MRSRCGGIEMGWSGTILRADQLSGVPMSEPTRPRNTVPPTPPNIEVRAFAALREFFRGYLHEDFMREYGSLRNAVQQFAHDANLEQRAEVVRQWRNFVELTRPQPLPVVVGLLTTSLG